MKVVALLALSGCTLYVGDGGDDTPASGAGISTTALMEQCAATEGPAIMVDSSTIPERLAGRWWFCAGAGEFYGPVEFTLDKHYYMLTETNGTLERSLGPTKSGTYSFEPAPPAMLFEIWKHPVIGDGPTYPLRSYIEENPTKLFVGGGFYVPIP